MGRRIWIFILIMAFWVVPMVGALGAWGGHALAMQWALWMPMVLFWWVQVFLNFDARGWTFWDDFRWEVARGKPLRCLQNAEVEGPRPFLVIAGCARNVEAALPEVFETIHAIGRQFRDYRVVVFENDSTDRTREVLYGERERDPERVSLLLEDGLMGMKWTERLAYGRNRLLDRAEELDPGREGWLLMMDLDEVNAEGELARTIHWVFGVAEGAWEALSANSRGCYYDLWALRIRGYLDYDFNERLGERPSAWVKWRDFERYRTRLRLSDLLLPAESAFNGATLYRMEALDGLRYEGLKANGDLVCEHVALHQQLAKRGGRLYILPLMQVDGRVRG